MIKLWQKVSGCLPPEDGLRLVSEQRAKEMLAEFDQTCTDVADISPAEERDRKMSKMRWLTPGPGHLLLLVQSRPQDRRLSTSRLARATHKTTPLHDPCRDVISNRSFGPLPNDGAQPS
jgi:hypothetical protein